MVAPDAGGDRTWLNHETDPHSNGPVLDDDLLADSEIQAVIAQQGEVSKSLKIRNTDRAVGARLAGAICLRQACATASVGPLRDRRAISVGLVGRSLCDFRVGIGGDRRRYCSMPVANCPPRTWPTRLARRSTSEAVAIAPRA